MAAANDNGLKFWMGIFSDELYFGIVAVACYLPLYALWDHELKGQDHIVPTPSLWALIQLCIPVF